MSANPLVSIIVPVYNVKKYLNDCIESVVGQSHENIEVIMVDDGSTDESGAMCDTWAKKDKRIKVVHKENEGLNCARKDGYMASSGEYITFLDSDDFFHKDNIKTSLKTLLDNNADVAIYASKEFSDLDTKDKILAIDEQHETSTIEVKEQIAHYALFGDGGLPGIQYMTVWGKLYVRKIVERVDWNVANYRVYEDNFWTPQALLEAKKVVLMSNPLIFYRRNVVYGANGSNLGNRMTGDSINGKPVGYIEFVESLRKFYHKLARDYGFGAKLDNRINKQAFLSKTWRIDNLVKAGLLTSENNMEYVLDILPKYIEAKNKHIENLSASVAHLDKSLIESNQNLTKVTADFAKIAADYSRLSKEFEEYLGIKRSAKLLLGNIKRKLIKPKD